MLVGIDPGLNGAIAFVNDDLIKTFDMPVIDIPWAKSSKYKRMVDGNRLYEILHTCPRDIERITIEIVGPLPAQGVSSTWAFSGAFYTAYSIARIFKEPNMIQPSKWKRKYGLINMPKDASRLACLKMYPSLADQLKRKKDVDRAEAILISCS